MNKQDGILLLEGIHPDFFDGKDIRNLSEECVFEEMILPLDEFEVGTYDKKLDDNVSFGYYSGDADALFEAVEKVIPAWVEIYKEDYGKDVKVYCGYIGGKVASFCIVEDMGVHNIGGRKIKVGGPWYGKLGYKRLFSWNKYGVLE